MKPLSQSAACAAKCLFAVMQYMKKNGGVVAEGRSRVERGSFTLTLSQNRA